MKRKVMKSQSSAQLNAGKFKSVLYVLLFLWSGILPAQQFEWAKQYGDINTSESPVDMAIDNQGNLYAIGEYINAPAVIGTYTLSITGSQDAFLYKTDPAGNVLWAVKVGDDAVSVAVDDFGNAFVAVFNDPFGGMYERATIVKVNSAGVVLSSHSTGGLNYNSRALSVAVDKTTNEVYLTGYYTNTFNYGSGPMDYITCQGKGGFIIKYTNALSLVWCKGIGATTSSGNLNLNSVASASDGSIVIAGDGYGSMVDFDPDAIATAEENINGIFLLKLDAAGNYVWHKHIHLFAPPSSAFIASWGTSVIVDSQNSVVLTGRFGSLLGTTDFDPGPAVYNLTVTGTSAPDMFILKLNAAGDFQWANGVGGNSDEVPSKISLDHSDNIFVTGRFSGYVDFNPGAGTHHISAMSIWDFFMLKLNTNGSYVLTYHIPGTANPTTGVASVIGATGNIYSLGWFSDMIDFDPGAATVNLTGGSDLFITKLSGCAHDAPDICLVTVDSLANNNVIYFDKSIYPSADTFIIYRYDALTTNYLKIGAVPASDTNTFLVDTARTTGGPNGGDPQYSSYRYKMAIRDLCGTVGTKGLYHESIFIQQNFQNFSWNAYAIEGQSSPASGYQFQRDNNGTGTWQVLVNTGGLSTTDPNYASYPLGRWRVDALGFSCVSGSSRMADGTSQVMGAINTSRSNIKSPTSVGLKELTQSLPVKVYPNPASDLLIVEFPSMGEETLIEIRNVMGSVVYGQKTSQLKNAIPCDQLEAGIYFVRVLSGKGQSTRKITVQ
ncbi:MAG: hypothetical protein K0S33_3265 [Bacteroidetes bacterium]|jgi:hypothetical protein|nr:hypothetical protein [Bacteroidota bacterium]